MGRATQSVPAKRRGCRGTPETKTPVHGLCACIRNWQRYSDDQTDSLKHTEGAFTELYSNTKRFTMDQNCQDSAYSFCSNCSQTCGHLVLSRCTSDEQQSPLPITYLVLKQTKGLSDHRDCTDSCIYGPYLENCSFSVYYPQTSFAFCFQFK